MSNTQQLSDEEIGRLIHARQEFINCIDEWKKHGWNKGLAARFAAMAKAFKNEPVPSPTFENLSKRMSFLTQEQTQTMINGALLAIAWRAGGRIDVPTHDIFEAHAAMGTLAVSITPDDRSIVITGMKKQ